MDMLSIKEMIQCATWDSERDEKMQFLFLLLFGLTFLSEMKI